jgi:putative acetyltransferase
MKTVVTVREETRADVAVIHQVNVAAFGTDAEAKLVGTLRDNSALTLSLVAESGGRIVGHIAFSPVVVTTAGGATVEGIGLAPMAVVPELQRTGIGGRLIEEGLRRLRDAGHRFCIVLGHAGYYPRHAFVPAGAHGLRWEKPGHDESFFVQALAPGGLDGVEGTVRYRPEFDAF